MTYCLLSYVLSHIIVARNRKVVRMDGQPFLDRSTLGKSAAKVEAEDWTQRREQGTFRECQAGESG